MSLSGVCISIRDSLCLVFTYVYSCIIYLILMATLWDFAHFIWDQDHCHCLLRRCSFSNSLSRRTGTDWSTWKCLRYDTFFLVLFMFSHSVKPPNLFERILPHHLFRSTYVLVTSLTIECLLCWWSRTPNVYLWKVDTTNNTMWWSIFLFITVMCWFVIYAECLMMDMSELTGLRQIYYYSIGKGNPLHKKTKMLQELYQRMRHPGINAFIILLWCHPYMTLDRLLMAVALTLYTHWRSPVTDQDYCYQRMQLNTKFAELK